MSEILRIANLSASIDGKQILDRVQLTINSGEIHAIMGKNGSGKSTLSNIIMGHPAYQVTGGDILFKGNSILSLPTDERARLGIFLSFQHPTPLPGVTMNNFFKTILKANDRQVPARQFRQNLKENMQLLDMDSKFTSRYVNDGFSGGEKKRNEILQMSFLEPSLSILDEIDSGLDIDALKTVCQQINRMKNSESAFLMITHYQRMLNYIIPDFIHVFVDGKIIKSGGAELAQELEQHGYDWVTNGGEG